MVWAEIGSAPEIEQAGMDGSNRRVLVNTSLSWPASLTFDLLGDRLYWVDEKLRCIGSASLDGENLKVHVRDSDWFSADGFTYLPMRQLQDA